jgi:hypothetical protein
MGGIFRIVSTNAMTAAVDIAISARLKTGQLGI